MKRSRNVGLVLMGASSFALAACDDVQTEQANIFNSKEQCIQSGDFTQQQCEQSLKAAIEEHEKQAPRYSYKAACEQEFGAGRCYEDKSQSSSGSGGGSFFMPFLAGYMVSNALNSFSRPTPLYWNSWSGGYATPGGDQIDRRNIDRRTGRTRVARSAIKPVSKPKVTRTKTVARGGFGKRARSGGYRFGG